MPQLGRGGAMQASFQVPARAPSWLPDRNTVNFGTTSAQHVERLDVPQSSRPAMISGLRGRIQGSHIRIELTKLRSTRLAGDEPLNSHSLSSKRQQTLHHGANVNFKISESSKKNKPDALAHLPRTATITASRTTAATIELEEPVSVAPESLLTTREDPNGEWETKPVQAISTTIRITFNSPAEQEDVLRWLQIRSPDVCNIKHRLGLEATFTTSVSGSGESREIPLWYRCKWCKHGPRQLLASVGVRTDWQPPPYFGDRVVDTAPTGAPVQRFTNRHMTKYTITVSNTQFERVFNTPECLFCAGLQAKFGNIGTLCMHISDRHPHVEVTKSFENERTTTLLVKFKPRPVRPTSTSSNAIRETMGLRQELNLNERREGDSDTLQQNELPASRRVSANAGILEDLGLASPRPRSTTPAILDDLELGSPGQREPSSLPTPSDTDTSSRASPLDVNSNAENVMRSPSLLKTISRNASADNGDVEEAQRTGADTVKASIESEPLNQAVTSNSISLRLDETAVAPKHSDASKDFKKDTTVSKVLVEEIQVSNEISKRVTSEREEPNETSSRGSGSDPARTSNIPHRPPADIIVPNHPTGKRFFSGINKRPLKPGKETSLSTNDPTPDWLRRAHHRKLEEHPLLSREEVRFLKVFDDHMLEEDLCADMYMSDSLDRFINKNRSILTSDNAMRVQFRRKLQLMRVLDIIDDRCVILCLRQIERVGTS